MALRSRQPYAHDRTVRTARSRALAAAACCAALALHARAQDEGALRNEVRACAALEREGERLECFDAIARAVAASTSAQAQAPTSAARASPSPEPPLAQRDIVSTVASLREVQLGRLEITLANGQVWRQVNSDRYALAVGHEVRIYPTRFGSYFRLTAKALRSFIQVERVR